MTVGQTKKPFLSEPDVHRKKKKQADEKAGFSGVSMIIPQALAYDFLDG